MSDASTVTVPVTIDREAPLPPAEDFAALKAQALQWLPEWCAGIWTDFNDHDPGIMILEQVTYASTELAYRANLPMDRLLGDATGKIPWRDNSLYAPTKILPMQPLTAADYARMLYDRIPSLVYAWAGPLPPADQRLAPGVGGLLQARVAVSPDAKPEAGAVALAEAAALLARNCNLGERFETVAAQPFVFFELTVTLQLKPGADPDTVRDNLYLAVRRTLLPGPQFRTLAQALADETIDAALSGPLLERGVLEDAGLPGLWQWTEAKERTAQAILGVSGVKAVSSIVFSNEADVLGQSQSPQGQPEPRLYAPALVSRITPVPATAGARAGYCVTFLLPQVLQPQVNMPGTADARTNVFIQAGGETPAVQFGRLLPSPAWDMPPIPDEPTTVVGEYFSIQNTFPACFKLQANALPPPDPPLRRAQVWQLKGYLLVFEQLMANYFAQLAGTSTFFSNQPQASTVFVQPLSDVPGVLPLLRGCDADDLPDDPRLQAACASAYWAEGRSNPYLTGLHAIAEDAGLWRLRRCRVLDQLLARFNESFSPTDHTTYETIVNKENLLQAYPDVGLRRAAAADVTNGLTPGETRPRSGLEEKIQLLLRRDTQTDLAPVSESTGAPRAADAEDFYFVLEPVRFLPRADSESAGERWNLPLNTFAPGLFHVYLNWTLCPLTGAFTDYVEGIVGENVPAHLWSRHLWLETHPVAEANVARFRALVRAWALAGYPSLVLAPPRLASDPPPPAGTIDVCRGTAAADLFAWLLDPTADPTGPADYYFVLDANRFLPRADSESAGERWNLPASDCSALQFHVCLNWTARPLTLALTSKVEAYVRGTAPAGVAPLFIWLETRPHAVPGVEKFRHLLHAWTLAGCPPLVLAPPRLDTDPPLPAGTIDVCRGTAAADLFAWLLEQAPPPPAAQPVSP